MNIECVENAVSFKSYIEQFSKIPFSLNIDLKIPNNLI
jgi:hypothetical protein